MNKRAHPPVVIQMGNAQQWTRRVRAGMTEDAQSLEEVGTPGHSVCTQLDHPHKNESLHHGSPLSEFMSTYHAQELSTFTLDFTPGFWAQVYCAQLFPMASFLLSEEKESPCTQWAYYLRRNWRTVHVSSHCHWPESLERTQCHQLCTASPGQGDSLGQHA